MGTLDKSSSTLENENGLGLFSTGGLVAALLKGVAVVRAAVVEPLVLAPGVVAVVPKLNGLLVNAVVVDADEEPPAPKLKVGTAEAVEAVVAVVEAVAEVVVEVTAEATVEAVVVGVDPNVKVVDVAVVEGAGVGVPKVKGLAEAGFISVVDVADWAGLVLVSAGFPKENTGVVVLEAVSAGLPNEKAAVVGVVVVVAVVVSVGLPNVKAAVAGVVVVVPAGLPNETDGVDVVVLDSDGFPKEKLEVEAVFVASVDDPKVKGELFVVCTVCVAAGAFVVIFVVSVGILGVDVFPKGDCVAPKLKAEAGFAGWAVLPEVLAAVNVKAGVLDTDTELDEVPKPMLGTVGLFASVLAEFVEPKVKGVLLEGAANALELEPKEISDVVRRRLLCSGVPEIGISETPRFSAEGEFVLEGVLKLNAEFPVGKLFEPNELPEILKPVTEAVGLLDTLPLKLRPRFKASSGLKTKLMLPLSVLFLDL